jgi:hypothetical protein
MGLEGIVSKGGGGDGFLPILPDVGNLTVAH